MAAGLAVLHEGRIEGLDPGFVALRGGDCVNRLDQIVVDQREHVGRQQNDDIGRITGLGGGHRLHDRVLIAAGIDRLHGDIGMRLAEVGDITVDDLGDRAADGDRIIEGDLGRGCGSAAQNRGRERCGNCQPGKFIHAKVLP